MHATRSRAMLVALAVVTGAAAPAMMMEPKGTFAGAKDHSASGSYTITGSGKDRALELSSNFKVDKAPDIYVILSRGTMAKDAPWARWITAPWTSLRWQRIPG
jgi:hypothetical protein